MTAQAIEILHRTRSLIDEKGWTQGASARDAAGNDVMLTDESAVCYCLSGAFDVASRGGGVVVIDAELLLAEAIFRDVIGEDDEDCRPLSPAFDPEQDSVVISFWNDAPARTKADVLAVIDKAISLARAREGES
jgi:hypothetical protein